MHYHGYQGDLTLQIILYVHNKCCFTYLNKILSQWTKGVRISEDALYICTYRYFSLKLTFPSRWWWRLEIEEAHARRAAHMEPECPAYDDWQQISHHWTRTLTSAEELAWALLHLLLGFLPLVGLAGRVHLQHCHCSQLRLSPLPLPLLCLPPPRTQESPDVQLDLPLLLQLLSVETQSKHTCTPLQLYWQADNLHFTLPWIKSSNIISSAHFLEKLSCLEWDSNPQHSADYMCIYAHCRPTVQEDGGDILYVVRHQLAVYGLWICLILCIKMKNSAHHSPIHLWWGGPWPSLYTKHCRALWYMHLVLCCLQSVIDQAFFDFWKSTHTCVCVCVCTLFYTSGSTIICDTLWHWITVYCFGEGSKTGIYISSFPF